MVIVAKNITTVRAAKKPKPTKTFENQRYGQIWLHKGTEVFILGNSESESGTLWTADRVNGHRLDPLVKELEPCGTGLTAKQEFDELIVSATKWAREGNGDAAWWLGWLYEGTNHPKATWYSVAAKATKKKILQVIEEIKNGKEKNLSAWEIGVAIEAINQSEEYKSWSNAEWEKALSEQDSKHAKFEATYGAGFCSGEKNLDVAVCPWERGTWEFSEWMNGFSEGLYTFKNPSAQNEDVPF